MTPFFAVLRVVNVLPQVQFTVVSTYSGWISGFTSLLLVDVVAGSSRGGEPVPVLPVGLNQPAGGFVPGYFSPSPGEVFCTWSRNS
jgi:hypothetical protein